MRRLSLLIIMALSGWMAFAQLKKPIADPSVMARRFAESEMTRFPEAWQLDHGKRLFFGYAQGVGCCAMLEMWKATGEPKYWNYVHQWADSLVAKDGEIWKYDMASYNLDFINSGKVLFDMYAQTHEKKYKVAMETLRRQLKNQPRTCDGGFWHKLVYQHQMWLDGLYMASPFLARYGEAFGDTTAWEEAVYQVITCHRHTYDTRTGLYFHAWDESRRQRWADENGHSPNFWGRSTGWWFMAMVDILDWIPAEMAGRDSIVAYVKGLAEVLPKYQRKGLWYQVLDCPEKEGNFPEASVTTQFMYAYAKAVKKGYIDEKYLKVAQDAYQGLQKTLLVETDQTTAAGEKVISLTRCCAVGGLGGNPYRDGSFEYYIHEKMRDNDAKATGPFIMGCLWLSIK